MTQRTSGGCQGSRPSVSSCTWHNGPQQAVREADHQSVLVDDSGPHKALRAVDHIPVLDERPLSRWGHGHGLNESMSDDWVRHLQVSPVGTTLLDDRQFLVSLLYHNEPSFCSSTLNVGDHVHFVRVKLTHQLSITLGQLVLCHLRPVRET